MASGEFAGSARPRGVLRRQLGLIETMMLSVGIIAPTAAIALNGALAASIAGTAVPLVFLGAIITIALIAFSFVEFSRVYAHPGSVYVFNGMAFRPQIGFLSAWALLLTYVAFAIASCIEVGLFVQVFLGYFSASIPWIVPALVAAVIVWILAHRAVKLSVRTTGLIEAVSVTLILVVTAIILVRGGAHGLSLAPFAIPKSGLSSVGLASVFAFLSFAGFEGMATLGEESKNPTKTIPRALIICVAAVGAFFLLVVYAQSEGFGLDASGVKGFASSSAPAMDLAKTYVGTAMAVVIAFGATISTFGAALSVTVAGARILFALGRDGFGPSALGRAHPKHASPFVAVAVVVVITVVVLLALSGQTGLNAFGWIGTLGVLALLPVYATTQVASIVFFRRIGRWRSVQFIIPVVAIGLLGYAFYSNVIPVPAPPYNYFPYAVVAWILAGAIVIFSVPGLARRLSTTFVDLEKLPTARFGSVEPEPTVKSD